MKRSVYRQVLNAPLPAAAVPSDTRKKKKEESTSRRRSSSSDSHRSPPSHASRSKSKASRASTSQRQRHSRSRDDAAAADRKEQKELPKKPPKEPKKPRTRKVKVAPVADPFVFETNALGGLLHKRPPAAAAAAAAAVTDFTGGYATLLRPKPAAALLPFMAAALPTTTAANTTTVPPQPQALEEPVFSLVQHGAPFSNPAVIDSLRFRHEQLTKVLIYTLSKLLMYRFAGLKDLRPFRDSFKNWQIALKAMKLSEHKRKTPLNNEEREEMRYVQQQIQNELTLTQMIVKHPNLVMQIDEWLSLHATIASYSKFYACENPAELEDTFLFDPHRTSMPFVQAQVDAYKHEAKADKRSSDSSQESENDNDNDNDDDEDKDNERASARPSINYDLLSCVQVPVFLHVTRFAEEVHEAAAEALYHWTFSSSYQDGQVMNLEAMRDLFLDRVCYLTLWKQLPKEYKSPSKMIQAAIEQHQEHMQEFGKIVEDQITHRAQWIQQAIQQYQARIIELNKWKQKEALALQHQCLRSERRREQRKWRRDDDDNREKTMLEMVTRITAPIVDRLQTLNKLMDSSCKHNAEIQNSLTDLLSKISKSRQTTAKENKEKETPPVDYRGVLQGQAQGQGQGPGQAQGTTHPAVGKTTK